MTTVAVLADPPVADVVLPDLVGESLLTPAEAVDLYVAALVDVCEAVRHSGGDLLVNYRPADQLSADVDVDDAEALVRETLAAELPDADGFRYEVQVGSSRSARVGNTITHLLQEEGVRTAAVVPATAAFLGRQHVDSAAMKLRRSDVVLGPATEGRVYYAGFAEPVDFTDALDAPAVRTLAERGADADLGVDFLPVVPTIERLADLATVIPLLQARQQAGKPVPTRTADQLDALDLELASGDGGLGVRRD